MKKKKCTVRTAAKKIQKNFEAKVVNPIYEFSTFLNHFIKDPKIIGALTPSSPFLAKAVVKRIHQEQKKNRRILEIGAGSGAITKQLINELNPGDHLDLIECVPGLIDQLTTLIENSKKKDQISLHVGFIEDFHPKEKYDQIVSGLPLTVFPPEKVVQFYEQLEKELLKKEGLYSYYEYLGLSQLRMCYYTLWRKRKPKDYSSLKSILTIKNNYLSTKTVEKDTVWFNLTPMRIFHVKK